MTSSNRRRVLAGMGGALVAPAILSGSARAQGTYPNKPAATLAYRDAEEARLAPVIKASGARVE